MIACDELPERKAACQAHLESQRIPFTFWRGIFGRSWMIRATEHNDVKNGMSPGYVALSINHWVLWQHLYHTMDDFDVAQIFEDDVSLPDEFAWERQQVIIELYEQYPEWQMCFIGLLEGMPNPKISKQIGGEDSRFYQGGFFFGTHAYLLRKSALPVLLDHMACAEEHIDLQLSRQVLNKQRLEWCGVLPTLVGQRSYSPEGEPEWKGSCN